MKDLALKVAPLLVLTLLYILLGAPRWAALMGATLIVATWERKS